MGDAATLLSFFGLREQPFAPTADPAYFLATRGHQECLFRLWDSIDNRHGIAVVLGSYGTGKTTLLRKLIVGMAANPERYNVGVIGSPIPSWTSFALLENIVAQFGLHPAERTFAAYTDALNRYLQQQSHRITTLIIDDAQNLNKRGQIELLRLVQNLETPQHKLLNLVFFAQNQWVRILRAAPDFAQRINMTCTLSPMSRQEVQHLIEFRLEQAVGAPERAPAFSDGAFDVIHSYAEGNPRVMITLARNALLVAARLQTRAIGPEIVLHTIDKAAVPDPERRKRALQAAVEGARRRKAALHASSAQDERAAQLLRRAQARQGSTGE